MNSKFIQTVSGTLLNLSHIASIVDTKRSKDEVRKCYAIMEDGSRYELWTGDCDEEILASEVVPASGENNVIVGFCMDEGEPIFQACKVVAWRVSSGGAVPVLNDWQVQQCSNAIIGLIQWDGSVVVPESDGHFDSVEAFKEHVSTLNRKGGV